jgi:hypothetical protein
VCAQWVRGGVSGCIAQPTFALSERNLGVLLGGGVAAAGLIALLKPLARRAAVARARGGYSTVAAADGGLEVPQYAAKYQR